MKSAITLFTLLLFLSPLAFAQENEPPETGSEATELLTGVQDNSFLLEEGYNQEPGIVQHINLLLHDRDHNAWGYLFTQEWPVRSMKHQLSYAIPLGYISEGDHDIELGDVELNYRYQLIGNGESRLAVAPRLTMILPTGEESDATGVEIGLPISTILGSRVIAHTNVAAAWFNNDRETEYLAGQSLVFALTPRFNALIEALWTGTEDEGSLVISPGIRWGYNLTSGSQLVPGLAYVMSTDDEEGGNALLFYLSFENRFGRR
jgi:hypothetical protein